MSDVPVRVERRWRFNRAPKMVYLIAVAALVAVAIGAALASSSVVFVDVGEAAVVVDPIQRGIVSVVFGPSWALKAPWQYVKTVYVAVETVNFRAAEGTAIDALTKDGARVFVDVTIRFEIKRDPEAVKYLVMKYPANPREEVVRNVMTPLVRQVVRDVIAEYTLTEVIEKRGELPSVIASTLRERLEKDETIKMAVNVIDIAVRRIMPPENVLKAIEEKLKAQQEALAAQYLMQKQLTLANATRMAKIIEAEGEREAMIVKAEGQKKALELLLSALKNDTRALALYLLADAARSGNATILLIIAAGNTTIPWTLLPLAR